MCVVKLLACVVAIMAVRAAVAAPCARSVDFSTVTVQEKPLHVPPLEEAAEVLSRGLARHFQSVSVSVVQGSDSPDFSRPPYSLAAPGFTGNTRLVDLGGLANLVPVVQRDKVYDLVQLLQLLRRDPGLLIGAGAGPRAYRGVAGEGIINFGVNNGAISQGNHIVTLQPPGASKEDSTFVLDSLPATETRVELLGNYLLSDGRPGKVLKVQVEGRTGTADFVTAIREIFVDYYNSRHKVVGLGGIFQLQSGLGTYHVLPDYSSTPLLTEEAFNDWMVFRELSGPLLNFGTLVTGDLDLNLTKQHFHGYSLCDTTGGHYVNDTTPDVVKYEGYFTFAGGVLRVDPTAILDPFGDHIPSVDYSSVAIQEKCLYEPPLQEAADVLSRGLARHFQSVSVSVVQGGECPDFSRPPYSLAAAGFTGNSALIDIGGPENLVPLVNCDRVYDLAELLRFLRRDPALLIGAGAGPWPYLGVGCECLINLGVADGAVCQGTRIVSIQPPGAPRNESQFVLERLPPTETRVALLGNYLLSEGRPGRVIRVLAEKRTGSDNFITAIRKTLTEHYGQRGHVVGLGGVFLMPEGRGTYHVMGDYSSTPLTSDAAVNAWLHFDELAAPLVHYGTLVTGDLGLNLRKQHFHGYTLCDATGGHYDNDTTPDSVKYEGYFSFASRILRIDPPANPSSLGRD